MTIKKFVEAFRLSFWNHWRAHVSLLTMVAHCYNPNHTIAVFLAFHHSMWVIFSWPNLIWTVSLIALFIRSRQSKLFVILLTVTQQLPSSGTEHTESGVIGEGTTSVYSHTNLRALLSQNKWNQVKCRALSPCAVPTYHHIHNINTNIWTFTLCSTYLSLTGGYPITTMEADR